MRKKACSKKPTHSRPLPGVMGLKTVDCLECTKSGSGRTRSMISWSFGLGGLAWSEDRMAAGWGLDVTGPSTSWSELLLLPNVRSASRVLWSLSSKLSSNESIVFSKNWRHSCSSRLRNWNASSSCQGQVKVGSLGLLEFTLASLSLFLVDSFLMQHDGKKFS